MGTRQFHLGAAVRAAIGCAVVCYSLPAAAQLRIVDYNIAENYDIAGDPGGSGGMGGLEMIFTAIGAEVRLGIAKPIDILAVQESSTDGVDAMLLAGILNDVFGVSTYTAAPVPGNAQSGGNGLPGLVYNSATVMLSPDPMNVPPEDANVYAFGNVGSTGSQQPRSTLRYRMRPVGYDATAEFYIYNSHYKSDDNPVDQGRRLVEAQSIRDDADALGQGTHVLYVGDFNVYRSSEAMYGELLSAGSGQAFDPLNRPGNWNSVAQGESFKDVHSQSPATENNPPAFPGQVLGGMDNRFDFQLVTGELLDEEGLSYLSTPGPLTPPGQSTMHSYHVFGNNGSHTYSEAITTGSGAAANVLSALARSSDHLPVVADYQLPAKLGVQVASIPPSVGVGAAVSVNVLVQNLASAIAAIGADELDYMLSVSGDLFGGATGMDFALGGGNTHQVTLNTETAGAKSGMITVSTTSQGAAGTPFMFPVSFTVGGGGVTRVTVAKDDFDAPLNLTSFSQTPAAGAFSSTQDGFQRYQVGVSATIPNDLMDDSTTTFPADAWGIINRATKTDGWFGLADTTNPDNLSGNVAATWQFNVGGASSLEVSIDMGAMGDFELADVFNWTYSIDGGAFSPLFTSSVDEAGTAAYTLAAGTEFNVDDPLSMTTTSNQTTLMSNVLQTLTSAIVGTGNSLTIQLNANTNADDEAYAFDNIVVTGLVSMFNEADFNQDGFVNGTDLTAWKTNFGLASGAMKSQGDADDDDDVDGDDFLRWQRQLGAGSLVAAAAGAVPEPGSLAMGLLAALLLGARALRPRSVTGG